MHVHSRRRRWLLGLILMAASLSLVVRFWPATSTAEPAAWGRADQANPAPAEPVSGVAPPANVRIQTTSLEGDGAALLGPSASAWDKAAPTAILLNRTPRIYQTEPVRELTIPSLEVRALRAGDQLLVRMRWSDATKNAPEPPPRKHGEGGEPAQLYKRPTGETAAFPDAAAVMIPQRGAGLPFPSLMMGDQHASASLYYWNASRGAEEMTASGRATPKPTGKSLPHRATHNEGKWTLTLQLPASPDDCPVAFAIWDGQLGDRDGLKFFSIWYVLTRAEP